MSVNLNLEDNTFIQSILAKGRVEGRVEGELHEARKWLLRLGRMRLGPPSAEMETILMAIADLDRLERLGEHLLLASSWEELLAAP